MPARLYLVKGAAPVQTEYQLLKAFSSGDDTAIAILISQYEDRLYNLCFKLSGNRQDADDLYQQTWLKVLQRSAMFVPRSFQNWLYTICLNTYRDEFRKNMRRSRVMVPDADEAVIETAAPMASAETEAIESMTQTELLREVECLPDKLRLPIVLHYFSELDYAQSARVLGLPVGTVKSRLNTAKNRLRIKMEDRTDG